MKRIAVALMALLFTSCALFDSTPVIEVEKAEKFINDADTNKDGVLSAGEVLVLLNKLRSSVQ